MKSWGTSSIWTLPSLSASNWSNCFQLELSNCRLDLPPRPAEHAKTWSPSKAGLQAVDYVLWALQRHYERDESRYAELVWDKVVEIEDLDRIEGGRTGVVYNKKRPLIVDQGAPE